MKKTFLAIAVAILMTGVAYADEGMWLLPLLQKMNSEAMSRLGCRLTAEDIYSINNSSLKDAVVHFGGGCTGEMISSEGLLVTNHHCGYSSIQRLSSPEHNYLEDGYFAMRRDQELPVNGLSVTFLQEMRDVTDIVAKAGEKAQKKGKTEQAEKDRTDKMRELEAEAMKANPHCSARVTGFYNENVWYLIVYKTYNDVRFVGAPPVAIGKFGGEADNWTWPRHTGDFSMFRVYAGRDNEPAAYSEDNVPYRPARSLKISMKGLSDGDFAFIMGYPGRTQRFQTAVQLQDMVDNNNIRVKARTLRQSIMWEAMESDPAIRLKYANKYAGSANGWKKWQGEDQSFKKLKIIERETRKEAEFMDWVNASPARKAKYGTALQTINTAVAAMKEPSDAIALLSESIGRIELASLCQSYARQATGKTPEEAVQAMERTYQDYWLPLDIREAEALIKYYRDNADPANYPQLDGVDFATMDIKAYVAKLFAGSDFSSYERLQAAVRSGRTDFSDDPASKFYDALMKVADRLSPAAYATMGKLNEGAKAFTAGLLEWKAGEPSYPDANSTMRLTYGTMSGYSPKDGVYYKPYTYLEGVMEKENPDDYEFKVPAKLKQLWKDRDFGQYADATGSVPVCFLTTNDITGGNSGSPVMNADGELIGLAFDGNWEAMSSDVIFEPALQRVINVDIRYVLFLVDKLGGAGYLLDEMEIVK